MKVLRYQLAVLTAAVLTANVHLVKRTLRKVARFFGKESENRRDPDVIKADEPHIGGEVNASEETNVNKADALQLENGKKPNEECMVCCETTTKPIVPPQCKHTICPKCMRNFMFSTKQQQRFPAVCPASLNCQGRLEVEVLGDVLNAAEISDIYGQMIETKLLVSGNAFYCLRANCGQMLIVIGDPISNTSCPSCHIGLCAACKCVWHSNLTCQHYQRLPESERSPDDLALLQLVNQQRWKRCPRCKMIVSLTGGCNHVTCRCTHQFYYVCSADRAPNRRSCACK